MEAFFGSENPGLSDIYGVFEDIGLNPGGVSVCCATWYGPFDKLRGGRGLPSRVLIAVPQD